jgi:hypothetical protein
MPRTFIALAASRLGRPCRFDSPHGPPSPHPAAGAPAAARSVMPATSKARSPNLVALSPQRRSSCRRRGTCASLGASARQGLAPPPSQAPSRPNLGRPLTAGRARTARLRTSACFEFRVSSFGETGLRAVSFASAVATQLGSSSHRRARATRVRTSACFEFRASHSSFGETGPRASSFASAVATQLGSSSHRGVRLLRASECPPASSIELQRERASRQVLRKRRHEPNLGRPLTAGRARATRARTSVLRASSFGETGRQGLAPSPSQAPSRPNLGRPLTAERVPRASERPPASSFELRIQASARQGLAPPPSPAPSRANLGRPLTAGRARTTRGRTRRL